MKLIVGLGNPGPEYSRTRHNIGFMALDLLFADLKARSRGQKHHAAVARAMLAGEEVLLAKPLTYMNLSGDAVAGLLKAGRMTTRDLLVIYDDMDLPLGKVRVRARGGSGGHRGMQSIIACLGSEDFARIRVGISHPQAGEVVDYVLEEFTPEEAEIMGPALQKAADAARTWAVHGIERAMNTYN